MSAICPACGFNPQDPYKHDVDCNSHRVVARGEWVFLSGMKWDLFYALWEKRGQVLNSERLMTKLYGLTGDNTESNVLSVYICQLRKAIKGSRFEIENVWGVGYRLVMVSAPGKQLQPKHRAEPRTCNKPAPLPLVF